MKTFKTYLMEAEEKNKSKDGTYASFKLSAKSSDKLHKWLEDQKIPNLSPANDYHVTILYSRKVVTDDLKEWDVSVPIRAKIDHWKIFPMQTGEKCLVMVLDQKKFDTLHDKIIDDLGATHDFPSFIPHVTVSTNYTGKTVPDELPKFPLSFDEFSVEKLELDK
jgi:hypothetical protein